MSILMKGVDVKGSTYHLLYYVRKADDSTDEKPERVTEVIPFRDIKDQHV